jgi:oxalate decarboxylase
MATMPDVGEGLSEPVRGDDDAPILGPRNVAVERANPDLLVLPRAGAGAVPNLKFPLAAGRHRLLPGGWVREVTSRELPIATELAGVNMRLKAGGMCEMHWHGEAEWSYMISGRARITALDADGASFVDDVGEGDLWYFPAGIPHSIRGLEGGCEFLLVFDEGSFSENEASLSAHAVPSMAGAVPQRFSYRRLDQQPIRAAGATVRIADSSNFKLSTTIAAALVEVEPGAMRETHWHPNGGEWQYYLGGQGRLTVFAAAGKARTFDFSAGDVGYVPFAMGHHIENTGAGSLRLLEMFRSDRFVDVSLNQWMANRARLSRDRPVTARWRRRRQA